MAWRSAWASLPCRSSRWRGQTLRRACTPSTICNELMRRCLFVYLMFLRLLWFTPEKSPFPKLPSLMYAAAWVVSQWVLQSWVCLLWHLWKSMGWHVTLWKPISIVRSFRKTLHEWRWCRNSTGWKAAISFRSLEAFHVKATLVKVIKWDFKTHEATPCTTSCVAHGFCRLTLSCWNVWRMSSTLWTPRRSLTSLRRTLVGIAESWFWIWNINGLHVEIAFGAICFPKVFLIFHSLLGQLVNNTHHLIASCHWMQSGLK